MLNPGLLFKQEGSDKKKKKKKKPKQNKNKTKQNKTSSSIGVSIFGTANSSGNKIDLLPLYLCCLEVSSLDSAQFIFHMMP